MSFRGRLTLFFLLIVVVPMVAIGLLVADVAEDSATGKTDAALNEDLELAAALYDEKIAAATRIGNRFASDSRFGEAIAEGEADAIEDRLAALARGVDDLGNVSFQPEGGAAIDLGRPRGLAEATIGLTGSAGERVGTLHVSIGTPEDFARQIADAIGEEAFVSVPGEEPVGTAELPPAGLPGDEPEDLILAGEDHRGVSAELDPPDGPTVSILARSDDAGFLASRPGIAIAILVFILIAFLAAGMLTRTLQGQISAMLAAARRIGQGDFSGRVPVVGNDELAGLAAEFNEMRDRLAAQMAELQRQRTQLEASVDRIGQAFASGLDREQLLKILVETAVAATDAEYGLIALAGHAGDEVEDGSAGETLREVALAAEHDALRRHVAVVADRDGCYALASSLGTARGEEPVGAMTVARSSRPFSNAEQSVFLYLAGQAAASVENLALHELVSEQAITDDLTGLPNNRAFREQIQREAARAERFGHDLSLLILDVDDFKQVNDEYGHLQGDAVLRTIGEVLGVESREIDIPARYGGEEFVLALPETSLEGAIGVAERVRSAIAEVAIPRVDGEGSISVTASIGAATMPAAGRTVDELIAAADAALYEAKRGGKNRVVAAQGNAQNWRTDAE